MIRKTQTVSKADKELKRALEDEHTTYETIKELVQNCCIARARNKPWFNFFGFKSGSADYGLLRLFYDSAIPVYDKPTNPGWFPIMLRRPLPKGLWIKDTVDKIYKKLRSWVAEPGNWISDSALYQIHKYRQKMRESLNITESDLAICSRKNYFPFQRHWRSLTNTNVYDFYDLPTSESHMIASDTLLDNYKNWLEMAILANENPSEYNRLIRELVPKLDGLLASNLFTYWQYEKKTEYDDTVKTSKKTIKISLQELEVDPYVYLVHAWLTDSKNKYFLRANAFLTIVGY